MHPLLPRYLAGSTCSRDQSETLSRNQIATLTEKLRSLEEEVANEEVLVAEFRKLKALFTTSGDEFKSAVAAALQELGLKCVDGPHPRADLLVSNGRRVAAVEAKGLDGSARETNFRQVERWKAEVNLSQTLHEEERESDPDLRRYAEQLRSLGETSDAPGNCKGIMIIGTFRGTPLNERTSPDFPDGVIRLLAQANVCALTGLQLFGLVLMARKNSAMKERIVDALYTTSGVCNLALAWRDFLEQH